MFNFDLSWFPKWNKDNPKDMFGPAIVLGAGMGAIVVAVLVIAWGNPWQTQSIQTGPRGTAMLVTKPVSEATTPDPTLADYLSFDPEPPEPGAVLAKDEYQNVQVLGDLTVDNFNRLMNAMVLWVAPEQGCAYCHGDGDLETYGEDTLYTKVVSRRMIQMTQSINADWDGHVAPAGVNCYTCHRGENVPSEIWFRLGPVNEAVAGWSAVQNRVTSASSFTSLPSDSLEKYLLEYEVIAVHDLEPRVPGGPSPARNSLPSWQNTERTYALMNYFSNALNVNCTFCHNSRAFFDPAENTPQWMKAQLAISMVQTLNNDYLVPLKDTYPANRLGPVHADAPKAACATCHKGYSKPMGGADMISDWPELASSEAPVYEAAAE
jgi:photosynthetic reaction center cytochrome c subunit